MTPRPASADGGKPAPAESYTPADRVEQPTLAQMTEAALTVLARRPDQPFALFIEAGDVDFALHANNLDNAVGAVYSGEDAVRAVIRWVETNSNWDDSLLLVSSDHGHYLVVDDPRRWRGRGKRPPTRPRPTRPNRRSSCGSVAIPRLPGEVEDVQRHGRAVGLADRLEVQPGAVRLDHSEEIVPQPAELLGGPLAAVRDRPRGVVVGEEVEIAGIRPRREPGRPPDLHRPAELPPILQEAVNGRVDVPVGDGTQERQGVLAERAAGGRAVRGVEVLRARVDVSEDAGPIAMAISAFWPSSTAFASTSKPRRRARASASIASPVFMLCVRAGKVFGSRFLGQLTANA